MTASSAPDTPHATGDPAPQPVHVHRGPAGAQGVTRRQALSLMAVICWPTALPWLTIWA